MTAYIGEGDVVINRLEQHPLKKPFWEQVVIITSSDPSFNKAHARFLEAELFRITKAIGRYKLENGNEPSGGAPLSRSERAFMLKFIEYIKLLMPTLGFNIFRGRSTPTATRALGDEAAATTGTALAEGATSVDGPLFYMAPGATNAVAQVIDGESTLLQGSVIPSMMKDSPGMGDDTRKRFIRTELLHNEVRDISEAGPKEGLMTLTKDFAFNSPSAAAAVVRGTATANGRKEWKTESGQALWEWEDAQAVLR